jgi:hypothetical protein
VFWGKIKVALDFGFAVPVFLALCVASGLTLRITGRGVYGEKRIDSFKKAPSVSCHRIPFKLCGRDVAADG